MRSLLHHLIPLTDKATFSAKLLFSLWAQINWFCQIIFIFTWFQSLIFICSKEFFLSKATGSSVLPLVASICITFQQISAQKVTQKICLLSSKSKQALRRYHFNYKEEVETAPKCCCFLCRPPGEEGDSAGSVFGHRPALPPPSQHLGTSHLPPGAVRWAKAASGDTGDAQTSFYTKITETENKGKGRAFRSITSPRRWPQRCFSK